MHCNVWFIKVWSVSLYVYISDSTYCILCNQGMNVVSNMLSNIPWTKFFKPNSMMNAYNEYSVRL